MEVVNFTFTNEVEGGDVWILPNTKENRETSLWGKATVPKAEKGIAYPVFVNRDTHDEYLFRMIDRGDIFYDGGVLMLYKNQAITLVKGEEGITIIVTDSSGNIQIKKAVFNAAL